VGQEVADLEEARMLGELLDGIAAVQQHALVAIDVGDGAAAAGRRHEARVVGEVAGFLVELADVDALGTEGPTEHGEFDLLVAGFDDHAVLIGHDALLILGCLQ